MTNCATPTPIYFRPVPAVPITVLTHQQGGCRVIVAGRVAEGATLRAAIVAAAEERQDGR